MNTVLIKKFIPQPVKKIARHVIDDYKIRQARKILDAYTGPPSSLGLEDLLKLQKKYNFPPEYGYDKESLLKRGEERANYILNLFETKSYPENFLELGCWDGMVSYSLVKNGKKATAVDFTSEGFDQRAVDAGVVMLKMNGSELSFQNNSFDCIFCFNTFEHFGMPDKVLAEIYRVLKPGGYFYCVFNPIYSSAYGLHAYRSITVPYCQYLFEKENLDEFCRLKKLNEINYKQLNYWTVDMFRSLWNSYSGKLKQIKYTEQMDYTALDLVIKYPSSFKSKAGSFDNLVVAGMECFFQKYLRKL